MYLFKDYFYFPCNAYFDIFLQAISAFHDVIEDNTRLKFDRNLSLSLVSETVSLYKNILIVTDYDEEESDVDEFIFFQLPSSPWTFWLFRKDS